MYVSRKIPWNIFANQLPLRSRIKNVNWLQSSEFYTEIALPAETDHELIFLASMFSSKKILRVWEAVNNTNSAMYIKELSKVNEEFDSFPKQ